MTTIVPAAAFLLAAVLGLSAVHKLADRTRLIAATAGLLRLNSAIAMPVTMATAALEMAAALALAFPSTRPVGALLAAILWSAYGIALLAARRRGESAIDCGCDFGSRRSGIGNFVIGRAAALGFIAVAIIAYPAGGSSIDIHAIFAALAFLALLFAAGEIAHLPVPTKSATR